MMALRLMGEYLNYPMEQSVLLGVERSRTILQTEDLIEHRYDAKFFDKIQLIRRLTQSSDIPASWYLQNKDVRKIMISSAPLESIPSWFGEFSEEEEEIFFTRMSENIISNYIPYGRYFWEGIIQLKNKSEQMQYFFVDYGMHLYYVGELITDRSQALSDNVVMALINEQSIGKNLLFQFIKFNRLPINVLETLYNERYDNKSDRHQILESIEHNQPENMAEFLKRIEDD